MRRRDFIAGCVGLPLLAKAGDAQADSGPLTKIIFPFAAGGGGDTLCRILAQHLILLSSSAAPSSSKTAPAATG